MSDDVPAYRDSYRDTRSPWALMPLTDLIDRLQAISRYHRKALHADTCAACGRDWPCPSWRIATDTEWRPGT